MLEVGNNGKASSSISVRRPGVTLETGAVARQATGAVVITMGETQILATVVGAKNVKPGQKFFPLSVHYQEKTYAAGKIPGGYFKREGRPTEKETLTSRLVDRPIRPLFPNGYMNEVQVVLTVMSASKTHDSDIVAMLGASARTCDLGYPIQWSNRCCTCWLLRRRPVHAKSLI